MRLNDPAVVRDEYASERGVEGRRAAYRYAEGRRGPGELLLGGPLLVRYHAVVFVAGKA